MTSARDLTARLADLLRRERASLAEFLVALADFDQQRRWLELGYSSLFYFLHRELGLSKSAAFQRMTAAQLIEKYPEVIEPLRDGRLCLSTVAEVAKVITPENRGEVLARYFHLSKREDGRLRGAAAPRGRPASGRRDGGARPGRRACALAPGFRRGATGSSRRTSRVPERGQVAGEPSLPTPPSTGRGRAALRRPEPAHLTVSRRFLEKLEAARAALSHSKPGASEQDLLEAGLDLLLERHAKRRGLVSKPMREPKPAKPEHVPAHVKRAVWARDGGKCQWPLDGGGVCGSTHQIQFDHIVPRGRGGPSTIDNVRLTCRLHDDLAAREVYGDAWMDRYARGRSSPAAREATSPP